MYSIETTVQYHCGKTWRVARGIATERNQGVCEPRSEISQGGTCEIWAPVQDPQATQQGVATELGIDLKAVTVNVTLLGGAFGRKSKPDFVVEAALISKNIGGPAK